MAAEESPRRARLPKGIRLNNPGNIRRTTPRTPWQGLLPLHEAIARDNQFESFETAVKGLRALARNLVTYQDKHGLTTVREWIGRWAPANGKTPDGAAYTQNTEAYARAVARHLNVDPDATVSIYDFNTALGTLQAITVHENGNPRAHGYPEHWYPVDIYMEALRQAGITPKAKPIAQDRELVAGGTATVLAGVSAADGLGLVKQYVEPGSMTAQIIGVLAVAALVYLIVRRLRKRKVESQ